jgi:hypothetical protein
MDDLFITVVPRALSYLYREGRTGHWVDARTSSYAVGALTATGESFESRNLQAAAAFLLSTFREEKTGGSWGSEIWDTALAIRALSKLPVQKIETVDKAFEWISAKQLPDGSFDGEPWDTLYVALAAVETGRSDLLLQAVPWLLSVQNDEGAFISPHYTGLFCQVIGECLDQDKIENSLHYPMREAATKALGYLWNQYKKETLWGGSAWTNAFIVRGMVALHHGKVLSELDPILVWFSTHQDDSGAWDDPVRTAISIEALWELKLFAEIDRCHKKPLQTLTAEFFSRSTQAELSRMVFLRTMRVPVTTARKLIDKDEFGNKIITLTQERELYIGITAATFSGLWAVVTNWSTIKHFLFP